MRNKSLLAMALLASLPPPPEAEIAMQQDLDGAKWWQEFQLEIEAIGGKVHPHLGTDGEIKIDVPEGKINEAKRIVAKYKTGPKRK